MSLDGARVKALLADFSESLSSILAEGDFCSASRPSAARRGSATGLDLELVKLSRKVGNVIKSLEKNCDVYGSSDVHNSQETSYDMSQYVIVCGPHGTEATDHSDARYDDMKSVVYSRTSPGVSHLTGCAPNYKQLLSIPPKDIPPTMVEVYARPTQRSIDFRRSHSSVLSTPPISPSPSPSSSSSSSSTTAISFGFSPTSSPPPPRRQGLRNHHGPRVSTPDLSDGSTTSSTSHESLPLIPPTNHIPHNTSRNHKEDAPLERVQVREKVSTSPSTPVIHSDVFMGIGNEEQVSLSDEDAYNTDYDVDISLKAHSTNPVTSDWSKDTDSLFIGQASTDESDIQQTTFAGGSNGVVSDRESTVSSKSSSMDSGEPSSLSRVYRDLQRDFKGKKSKPSRKKERIVKLPRKAIDVAKNAEETFPCHSATPDFQVLKNCQVVVKKLDFNQFPDSSGGGGLVMSPFKAEKKKTSTPCKSPRKGLVKPHGSKIRDKNAHRAIKVKKEPDHGDESPLECNRDTPIKNSKRYSGKKSSSSSVDSITFSDVANDVIGNPESDHTPPKSPATDSLQSRGPETKFNLFKKESLNDTRQSQFSSDSDFDSPLISKRQSSQVKLNTDPPLRKKRKIIIKKCSSEDEERPFALNSARKGNLDKVRLKVKSEKVEDGYDGVEDGDGGVEDEDGGVEDGDGGVEDGYDGDQGMEDEDDSVKCKSVKKKLCFGSDSEMPNFQEELKDTSMDVTIKDEGAVLSEAKEPPDLSEMAVQKLGKHIKGPHSKGKEKALPKLVKCVACGLNVDWRKQKIHAHPRLAVIMCQKCYTVYYTGEFRKWGENEIFCSLCGDGGNILLCDYCDKSFCKTCVGRISGKECLQHLLEKEEELYRCYICEPSPLKAERELYARLRDYFKRSERGSERDKSSKKSGRNYKSHKYIVGANDGNSSDDVNGGGGATMDAEGEGGKGECSDHQGDSNVPKKSNEQGDDDSVPKGTGDGSGRRRGEKMSPGKSDGNSSSSEGERDSPDIGTDNLSLSDSDILKKMERRKSLRKKRGRDRDCDVNSGEKQSTKRKKKMMRISRFYNSSGENSSDDDNGDDGKGEEIKRKLRKRRKISNSNSEASLPDSKKSTGQRKRSRLAASLSSNSDEEELSPQKVLLLGEDMGEQDSDKYHRNRHVSSEGSDSCPIKYKMFEDQDSSNGSSSNFEVSLQRKSKKKKDHKSVLSSSNEATSSETSKKTYRTRSRKKKDDFSSDEDFVPKVKFSKNGPKKRRKNIDLSLLTSDSSDESGSVGQGSGSDEEEKDLTASQEKEKGRKRRKIRKMIGDTKLADETKMAIQEEKERTERLKKRKNVTTDEEDRLVLEQDSETKEVILEVRKSLMPNMKPHQREGIKFLYDACVENLKRLSSGGGATGAILAHCMGLGKTLQVIAFADALLNCKETNIKRVLVLCPVNTMYNWKVEFFKWIPYIECEYNIYLLNETAVRARLGKIQRWFTGGGIIFMGYEMFRNLAISKRAKSKTKQEFKKFLLDPGADLVVCDEGHVMRNSKSSLSLIINQVKTRLRIVLTGTPLQNNLTEYYTMVNFVKPNLLGMPREFKNRFVNPITNGQCRDSSPFDIRTMKQRSHVLYTLLKDTVQRRDFRVLAKSLPPKKEYVLNIRLSSVQDQLYRKYLDKGHGYHQACDLFSTFAALVKVWNHPWILKLDEQRKLDKEEREVMYGLNESDDDDETLGGFIVLSSDEEDNGRPKKSTRKQGIMSGSATSSSTSCVLSRSTTPFNANSPDEPIVVSSDEELLPTINIKPEPPTGGGGGDVVKREDKSGGGDITNDMPPKSSHVPYWYDDLLPDKCEEMLELSGKLLFLFELLEQTKQLKEKVLVFSQNLLVLDIIEEFLSKPQYGDWIPALDYYRLDGSTPADIRTANMAEFNKSGNDRLRLFLISTRAGSLGVNLVAANRVVIFDACWNPSHDLQAIFRAYRYGQEKPVFVYRLLAQGTMEEKIYDRQVIKQSLSMRVVDEKQIGRHYSSSDLAELFTYTPPPPPPLPGSVPAKPYERPDEDLVLCGILDKIQPDWITTYHEHDSLLEHIDDEELSEEERKAAWDQYNQQMTVESAKYNLEALQNRLDTSSQEGGASGAANASSLQATVLHNLRVKSVNEWTSRAINTIREIKFKNNHLRQLKGTYTNSPMIPRNVKDDINTLENDLKHGYNMLAESIKKVNIAFDAFVKSPEAHYPLFSLKVKEQRQMLYNELEELRQLTANNPSRSTNNPSPPATTYVSSAGYPQPGTHPHPVQPHPLSTSQFHRKPQSKSSGEVSSTTNNDGT